MYLDTYNTKMIIVLLLELFGYFPITIEVEEKKHVHRSITTHITISQLRDVTFSYSFFCMWGNLDRHNFLVEEGPLLGLITCVHWEKRGIVNKTTLAYA